VGPRPRLGGRVGPLDHRENVAGLAPARRRLAAVAEGVDHPAQEVGGRLHVRLARAAREHLPAHSLLSPRDAAEADVEPDSGPLGALHPDLRDDAAAQGGAERRALAVGAHLEIARAALAEAVDRDLADA